MLNMLRSLMVPKFIHALQQSDLSNYIKTLFRTITMISKQKYDSCYIWIIQDLFLSWFTSDLS